MAANDDSPFASVPALGGKPFHGTISTRTVCWGTGCDGTCCQAPTAWVCQGRRTGEMGIYEMDVKGAPG